MLKLGSSWFTLGSRCAYAWFKLVHVGFELCSSLVRVGSDADWFGSSFPVHNQSRHLAIDLCAFSPELSSPKRLQREELDIFLAHSHGILGQEREDRFSHDGGP